MVNHSDFNVVLDELVAGPGTAAKSIEGIAASLEEGLFRRAIQELEAECARIDEPMKSQLASTIGSLQAQFSLNGMTPNISAALQEARAQAITGVAITSQNGSAARDDAIGGYAALSSSSRARVDYFVGALKQGRIEDYYFKAFETDPPLDEKTKQFVGQKIANNPEVQAAAQAAQHVPVPTLQNIEAGFENNRNNINKHIANSQTEREKDLWVEIKKNRLYRIPGVGLELQNKKDWSVEELSSWVESAKNEQVKLARPIADLVNANTARGSALLQHYSDDGYSISDHGLKQLLNDGQSPEARRAVEQLRLAGGDYNQLPSEIRTLAAAGMFAHEAQAAYGYQTILLGNIREIYKEKVVGEKGHDDHFEKIFSKDIPAAERVRILIEEIREHGGKEVAGLSDKQLSSQARRMIKDIDLLDNPREAVLGLNGANFEVQLFREKMEDKLLSAGIKADGVNALLRLADSEPANKSMLEGAMRIIGSKGNHYDQQQKDITLQRLNTAAHVVTSPDYEETLSKYRYYNLGSTLEGQQFFNRAITGAITADAAASKVTELKQQVLGRMHMMREIIPNFVQGENKDYLERVRSMPGMLSADGSLNVEAIIEKARLNRDSLSSISDKQLGTIVEERFETLSEERKDMRALARVAAHFKATDMVRNFASQISDSYERIGGDESKASEKLKSDHAIYLAMTDASNPEVQRAAIDTFLKQEQYYRSSDQVRAGLTDYIIEISQSAPDLLRSKEFLAIDSKENGDLEVGDYMRAARAVTAATASISNRARDLAAKIQAQSATRDHEILNVHEKVLDEGLSGESRYEGATNQGDRTFQTKMEDRIQDVLNTMDMKQIVAKFGTLLGDYNVGSKDNVTHHEIENMLAASGVTDVKQLGSDRPTLDNIIDGLRRSQATLAVNAVPSEEIAAAAVYNAMPVQGPAQGKA